MQPAAPVRQGPWVRRPTHASPRRPKTVLDIPVSRAFVWFRPRVPWIGHCAPRVVQ